MTTPAPVTLPIIDTVIPVVMKDFLLFSQTDQRMLIRGILLAKAVDSRCVEDEECGGAASCKGSRCRCNDRQTRGRVFDLYGRPIDRCSNGNSHSLILAERLRARIFTRLLGVHSTPFSTLVFIALTLVWTILAWDRPLRCQSNMTNVLINKYSETSASPSISYHLFSMTVTFLRSYVAVVSHHFI